MRNAWNHHREARQRRGRRHGSRSLDRRRQLSYLDVSGDQHRECRVLEHLGHRRQAGGNRNDCLAWPGAIPDSDEDGDCRGRPVREYGDRDDLVRRDNLHSKRSCPLLRRRGSGRPSGGQDGACDGRRRAVDDLLHPDLERRRQHRDGCRRVRHASGRCIGHLAHDEPGNVRRGSLVRRLSVNRGVGHTVPRGQRGAGSNRLSREHGMCDGERGRSESGQQLLNSHDDRDSARRCESDEDGKSARSSGGADSHLHDRGHQRRAQRRLWRTGHGRPADEQGRLRVRLLGRWL